MDQWYATGKRKTAIARVFLRPGKGKITINGREVKDYFYTDANVKTVLSPLVLTETESRFDLLIMVKGGGISAQADAARHGISRALVAWDADSRPALKKEGFLRRDSRMKERKKYGQKGARAHFQFSKR